MMNIFFFLSTLFILGYGDPYISRLSQFKRGETATFDAAETGAKLYVASSDDNDYLKNIVIVSGATTTTLDTLNGYITGNTPKSLTITAGMSLRTSNSDTVTNVLTGYIYITTSEQANDPLFSVLVLKNKQAVSTINGNSTVVVLNTELVTDSSDIDKPSKTSYVSDINQSADTDMNFHWGIPPSNWTKVTENQFFENPLYFKNFDENSQTWNSTRTFFDHVEPLQIGLDYWYITTVGSVAMIMENKYVSNYDYTTTSVNSTGLIVNSFLYQQHVVNFLLDYTRNRTVGTLITTFPNSNDYISFYLEEKRGAMIIQNYNKEGYVLHALMTTYMQASQLTINSTSLLPGVFYCQYYGFTSNLLPVPPSTAIQTTLTTPSTTMGSSTTTVATTTKLSSANSIIQLISMIVAFVLFR
uniref:Secreted protein n=1 Tax=Caenorhabditis tropicalis TaxID=1561998 RepID=A0A1I7TPY6_9PELO